MAERIYKICQSEDWSAAEAAGVYAGSPLDRKDGFIHFSTAEQVAGTLAKYYADADTLVLVAVACTALGEALRYEPSRDGALFPHLYAPLPLAAVVWSEAITRDPDGVFVLPQACV
jgi:uncharacterized protein (DUF952 family)